MVEIRAALLPRPVPMRLHRIPDGLAGVSVRPLARGLFFLAALALPVLGSTMADRFHGRATGPAQVAAASLTPPRSGVAANLAGMPLPRTATATQRLAQTMALR